MESMEIFPPMGYVQNWSEYLRIHWANRKSAKQLSRTIANGTNHSRRQIVAKSARRKIGKIGDRPRFSSVFKDMKSWSVPDFPLDPTKVTRTRLQNAASVSSLMLTTDCMVAELVEDKPAGGGMGALGGMDM